MLRLFDQALALKVPHNVFAAWMVTPLSGAASPRPVDQINNMALLGAALAVFADRYRPIEKRR